MKKRRIAPDFFSTKSAQSFQKFVLSITVKIYDTVFHNATCRIYRVLCANLIILPALLASVKIKKKTA